MEEIVSYTFVNKFGEILDQYNYDTPLMPASNLKIITSYMAFKLVGDNYQITTKITKKDRNLIFSGGPTPLLRATYLVKELSKCKNCDRIIFSSSIDNEKYNKRWYLEDINHCYASPIQPFSVDEGCIKNKNNEEEFKPVSNQLKHIVNILRSEEVVNTGNYSVTNQNREGAEVLMIHREKVGDILKHMMEVSCNFSAELLLKYAGYLKFGRGTWENGINAIKKYVIEPLNLPLEEFSIYDGSGLSRSNMVTTKNIAKLLFNISKNGDKKFFDYLIPPGKGTLKNRLSGFNNYGIRAKTGTLGGVSALSGIINKKGIYFSIIINNSLKETEIRQRYIDEILTSHL